MQDPNAPCCRVGALFRITLACSKVCSVRNLHLDSCRSGYNGTYELSIGRVRRRGRVRRYDRATRCRVSRVVLGRLFLRTQALFPMVAEQGMCPGNCRKSTGPTPCGSSRIHKNTSMWCSLGSTNGAVRSGWRQLRRPDRSRSQRAHPPNRSSAGVFSLPASVLGQKRDGYAVRQPVHRKAEPAGGHMRPLRRYSLDCAARRPRRPDVQHGASSQAGVRQDLG